MSLAGVLLDDLTSIIQSARVRVSTSVLAGRAVTPGNWSLGNPALTILASRCGLFLVVSGPPQAALLGCSVQPSLSVRPNQVRLKSCSLTSSLDLLMEVILLAVSRRTVASTGQNRAIRLKFGPITRVSNLF